MYAYCANNPVMYSDITGAMPEWLRNITIGIGIIAVLAIATIATAGIAGVGVGAALAAGFTGASLGSGAAATIVTIASSAFAGAVIGGTTSMLASGIMNACSGVSVEDVLNASSTSFMFGVALGSFIGIVNPITMAANEVVNIGIHMGINSLATVGTYLGQTAYMYGNLNNISVGGLIISAIGGASSGYLSNSVASNGYYNYLSIQGAMLYDYANYVRKSYN